MSFHLLLRRYSGKAYFKDPELKVLTQPEGACLFDGVPVSISGTSKRRFEVRDVACDSDFVAIQKQALGLKIPCSQVHHGGVTLFDVAMSDDQLLYRRAICGPKPFCFLMNTEFENFSHELVEKYMKRSLAYGMYPGFFSHNASQGHYSTRPELYERDRDLFKKYAPLCKLLGEAGWQAITKAVSSDRHVYL